MRPVSLVQHRPGTVLHGDCVRLMQRMAPDSVDFILTDPPYLVRYRSRDGLTVRNDADGSWLEPAYSGMYRVLKPGSLCLSFYGWNAADRFIGAWRAAGFRIVGHLVFHKRYASSQRYLSHHHEQAYLLAKGEPVLPDAPLSDVRPWHYTGNRLHPTQKPVEALAPLIEAFCPSGGVVLDPFCGSGSTLVAALQVGRQGIGVELQWSHCATARRRLRVSW